MASRPKFDRIWASGGVATDPGDVEYKKGYVKEKPPHEEQNFLQQKDDEFFLSVAETGFPTVGSDVTYKDKALAHQNGRAVMKTDAGWVETLGSMELTKAEQIMEEYYNKIIQHQADKSNPHNETAAQVGTYTKAESDTKVKVSQDHLDAHIADRSDPHEVTPQQLGTLPTTGGTFTGQAGYEDGITVGGKVVEATDKSIYMDKLGIKDGDSVFGDELLMHEGNYLKMRNALEPKYAAPSPDIIMPLSCDLTTWYGGGKVTASWDSLNFDPVKGLEVEGDITFSGEDALASDCTLSAIASGSVTIQIGNTALIELSEGVQYIPLLNWDVSDTNITISGSGFIKELRIWSMPLSIEQCDGIKQEDIVAGQNIFTNETTDGLGTAVIGTSTGISALQFNGDLGGAICTVLVDLNGGSNYTTIGSIDNHHPNKLVMLPAGAALNCRIEGATDKTNVSVRSSAGA